VAAKLASEGRGGPDRAENVIVSTKAHAVAPPDSIELSARNWARITGSRQTLRTRLSWALKDQRLGLAVGLEGLNQAPIAMAMLIEQSL
jgi:hypothetical protein